MATGDSNAVAKPKQEKRPRALQVSFKKRKECIMKKTWELSELCGVDACAIVIGANGDVFTWPENRDVVLKILNKYKDWHRVHNEKAATPLPVNDDPQELDESLGLSMESIEELLKEELSNDCVGDDNGSLLEEVESKLQAVTGRIEFLKSATTGGVQRQHCCLLEYVPQQSLMVPTPGIFGLGDAVEQAFFGGVAAQFNSDFDFFSFDAY